MGNSVFKGKVWSEKRIKVVIGLNIILSILLVLIIIQRISVKDYNSLSSVFVVGGIFISNFYTLSLRIKERKRLEEQCKIEG